MKRLLLIFVLLSVALLTVGCSDNEKQAQIEAEKARAEADKKALSGKIDKVKEPSITPFD